MHASRDKHDKNLPGVTRAELEKQTKPLAEEALKLDPYRTEELFIQVTGAPAFAWQRLKGPELRALRRGLYAIVLEGRG